MDWQQEALACFGAFALGCVIGTLLAFLILSI